MTQPLTPDQLAGKPRRRMISTHLRLTPEQHAKLKAIGGHKTIRRMLDNLHLSDTGATQ